MEGNAYKFLLLGVLGVSVFFSRGYIGVRGEIKETDAVSSLNRSSLSVPLFVLPSADFEKFGDQAASESYVKAGDVPVERIDFNPLQEIKSQSPPLDEFETDGRDIFELIRKPPPTINAYAALVADIETGEIYFSKNSDKRWPLASVTKLMTAVIAFEEFDMSEKTELSDGSKYRVRDLLKMMLLASNNDAAEAISALGHRSQFIDRMNRKAISWGMNNTYFADPTGVGILNQSTAEDLRIFISRVFSIHPEIIATTKEKSATVTELGSLAEKTVLSNNLFAGRADFLGGKTGYTEDALGNLVSVFQIQGKPVLFIVLGTADRFGETLKLHRWLTGT